MQQPGQPGAVDPASFSDEGMSPDEHRKKLKNRARQQRRRAKRKAKKQKQAQAMCAICAATFCDCPNPTCQYATSPFAECQCPPICRGCFFKTFPMQAKRCCNDPGCRGRAVDCTTPTCPSAIHVDGVFVDQAIEAITNLFA